MNWAEKFHKDNPKVANVVFPVAIAANLAALTLIIATSVIIASCVVTAKSVQSLYRYEGHNG